MVIELKRDAIPKVVINNLYKHTQLESSFAVNILAIDHGRPKILNLKALINCYIEHRREVVLRRTRFDFRKAEEGPRLLEGYLIALANLDEFIRIIRSLRPTARKPKSNCSASISRGQWWKSSASSFAAKPGSPMDSILSAKAQTNAILDLRLYQLTGLERDKVKSGICQCAGTD